jgi:hypothetical protein
LGQQNGIEFWRFQRDKRRHTSSIVRRRTSQR